MNDFVISIFTDPNTYLVISTAMSMCLFAWFLGYGIRLVLSLLYKILNVV